MTRALALAALVACDTSASKPAARVVHGDVTVECGDRAALDVPDAAIVDGLVCDAAACTQALMRLTDAGWLPPECEPVEGVEKWIEVRWVDVVSRPR